MIEQSNVNNGEIVEVLVVERIIECSGSTFLKSALRYEEHKKWQDISNYKVTYDLTELFNQGWVIVDTAVSSSISISPSGTSHRIDHTILTLKRTT